MQQSIKPIQLKSLDEPIDTMRAAKRAVKRPTAGWLKAVRQGCSLTVAAAAKRIGVSRQSYSQFEDREAAGTISLENLNRAAGALECDLVYFLLPRKDIAETFAALAARNDPTLSTLRASEHSMLLEGQGSTEEVDSKNIGLAKQLYWLRQNLSLYELVSVNAGKIKDAGASDALFGHIQRLALEAIVVTLCKIYEREKSSDLNSIDGVLNALANTGYTDAQRLAAERFARRQGMPRASDNPKEFLHGLVTVFLSGHASTFTALRRFRDKFAAHSEHGFELETLPSFDDFEALYQFAYDFYFLVSDSFLEIGPALMSIPVSNGFRRLLTQIGVKDPAPGFPLNSNEQRPI
jgi:predicted DNA-binding mobile mystery protein A